MYLCRYKREESGPARIGFVEPDSATVRPIGHESTTIEQFLADGVTLDALRESAATDGIDIDAVSFLAPIERPLNLVGIGLNYVGHAEEGGFDIPEEPIFFAKSPSSITGPETPIVKHAGVSNLHYEGEFGVVIGETIRKADPDTAISNVFGFVPGNDVTARDIQATDMEDRKPWYRSKSMDTFTPLGPWIIPRETGFRASEATLETTLNGTVVQSTSLSDLIFPIGEALSYVSQQVTLHPGDVVLTGTPAGIGAMNPGDTVTVSIDDVATLRNTVRSPADE